MALYALDNLDDAVAVTREFLTPVERAVWIRLAIVALFIGGLGTSPTPWSFGGDGGTSGDLPPIDFEPWLWFVIAAVVVVAILLGLAVLLVGSIMEFVFVESLRNESVTVRRYWRRRWRQGVRLFAFRLILGLVMLVAVALVIAPFLLGIVSVGSLGVGVLPVLFFLFVPVFVVLAIVVGLVHAFTTEFVVPIMIVRGGGVLDGWRALWPTIRAQWRQYLAYAVVGFFLSVLGGIAVGIATVLFVLLALIPFGVLFALSFGLFVLVPPVGILSFVIVGLLAVIALIGFVALAQVPVKTYLRYYALLVLGDVDPTFDLVATQRDAVGSDPTDGDVV